MLDNAEPGDQAGPLGDFAAQADRLAPDIQWSYRRTFGRVRIVVIDSRSGRVLEEGRRRMVGEAEWQWVTESVAGDWNHVVLASSLPLLLPYGIHGLEAWNEAVCGGAWGQRLARTGERIRQELDLEHWASFGRSFGQFEELLTGLATGTYGRPPASVTVLGGDIHHSYLAAVDFPRGTNPGSSVYQAVCSPIHNVLPDQFRRGQQLITSRPGGRHWHRPPRRSAQAADPVADHPRLLVPQHALCPRVRWPPGADPLRPHRARPAVRLERAHQAIGRITRNCCHGSRTAGSHMSVTCAATWAAMPASAAAAGSAGSWRPSRRRTATWPAAASRSPMIAW